MRRFITAAIVAVALAATGAAPASAEQLVALGDSYSSGTGTRTYFHSGCQRSVYAYPYLVDTQRPNTELVFAACSGARTTDVLNNQVSSVTSATRWVTITIGGNDAGFSSVITTCAQPSWLSNCDGAINNAQNYIRNTLPGRLDQVYNAIKSRAPERDGHRPRLPPPVHGSGLQPRDVLQRNRDDPPQPDSRPAA